MNALRPLFLSLLRTRTAALGLAVVLAVTLVAIWETQQWPQHPGAWWGQGWDWLNLPWLAVALAWAALAHLWHNHICAQRQVVQTIYSAAYRTLPDAAGITSLRDGRFVDVNPAFCRMMGLELQQVIGRTNAELQVYATPDERSKLLDELSLRGQVEKMRILCQTGGELVPGTISAIPITVAGEECMLFVFHDMREHERTVQELYALNRQLQQAGHLARLGAWEDRRGQGLVYWSDVCYDMHGVPRGSALPRDYLNTFVVPEHRDRMRTQLQHCLRARSDWELEIQILRTDGRKLWVRSRGEAVLDDDGRITAMRGVMQDIDAQKRQEESIREREALLSITLEAASLGRWDWDLHTGLITGDAFWSTLNHLPVQDGPASLGQARQDWHWTELVGSHDIARFNQELLRHIDHPEDGPFDVTWRLQPAHGRSRWLRSMGKVVRYDLHGRAMRMLGVCLDVTTQQEQKHSLQQLAHFDALTGLANRIELAARLHEALVQARQSQQLLGVVYLDLDGFKPINDRLGHDAGDRLLVLVAKRLQHALRADDCVARFGGDEFVLLLSQIHTRVQCENLLQRLMASISRPYTLDGEAVQVTASIGYTLYPEDDCDADTLIRHADQAMYQVKQSGRNRIQAFDSSQERSQRAQQIQGLRIREGLEGGEFTLYVQPKVDTRHQRVVGVEVLSRWRHPERGVLSPQDFLPLIEGTELEVPFGQWALRHAMGCIEQLIAQGLQLQVAVNISARHLQQPGFAQWVTELLQTHPDVPPHWLDLEITESAALYDLQHVAQVLAQLRAQRISVTLDDFGTGYSSLTYLRGLPLDSLKIDRSFVRDMLSDPGDCAIVHGVVSLAQAFGYAVIAEGVESADQCTALELMGCHIAQGFHFAAPMPLAQLPTWLSTWSAAQATPPVAPAAVR